MYSRIFKRNIREGDTMLETLCCGRLALLKVCVKPNLTLIQFVKIKVQFYPKNCNENTHKSTEIDAVEKQKYKNNMNAIKQIHIQY